MPEKQGLFNFEKQEAGRDIYNIAIQHLVTGEKVNLLSIQYALRKGETTKGNFFKNEPEWVDFKKGYIVERKEVNEIANKLDTDKVHLVLGRPASGKSIILKNIGFKFANENKKVHIVELKKHQIEDVKLYFEAIPEINNENPIFIVDDAHLYPSECERLIRDFKSGGTGRLIIGSRLTEDILPTHPKKTSEFQFLNKTEIHSEDVTEEMIRTFLKKQHNLSDDRIEKVSINLQEYRKDLWWLSWALCAYKPENDSVDKEEIYEKIMVSITEIEEKDKKTISAEDAFLPLSIFYRFEIPIERDFLTDQLEIREKVLDRLAELSEIVETKEKGNKMLSLHHSSLAELFFCIYQNYTLFGKTIKKRILNKKDKGDLEYSLFCRYLTTTDPINTIDIVNVLGGSWEKGIDGEKILKNLLNNDIVRQIIENGIKKEADLEKIGNCISNIAFVNNKIGLNIVHHIDINVLLLKIENEKNVYKIGDCTVNIGDVCKEVALKLVNRINIDNLVSKIEKENDIYNINWCFTGIGISDEAAKNLRIKGHERCKSLVKVVIESEDVATRKTAAETVCVLGWAWGEVALAEAIFDLFDSEKYDKIIEVLNLFESVYPNFADIPLLTSLIGHVYLWRGSAYDRLGLIDNSLDDYNRAIELYRYNEKELDRVIDLSDLSYAFLYRASVYYDKEKYDLCLENCNQFIENESGDFQGYEIKAKCFLSLEQFNETIEAASNAIKRNSKAVNSWLYRTYAHMSLGNLNEALEDSFKVLELKPEWEEINVMRAKLFRKNGDIKQAHESLHKLKDWHGFSEQFLKKLIQEYLLLGYYKEADQVVYFIFDRKGCNIERDLLLGLIHFAKGDNDKAEDVLEQALEHSKDLEENHITAHACEFIAYLEELAQVKMDLKEKLLIWEKRMQTLIK